MIDCGTFWMRDAMDRHAPFVAPIPPDAVKGERDAWGTYPHMQSSDNFVVKWGNSGGVSAGEIDDLLESFETAWAAEIEEMGMPAPDGTQAYKFNVYIGDSGNGTPSSSGAGGYYYRDDDNFPYIVIAATSLDDATYVEGTAAHEFFHSLQDETGSYDYDPDGPSAWYWEATSDWVQGEVFPDNSSYSQFLFGYALLPELALSSFDYPDSGSIEEYHQYGAFIFPRFVSEIGADASVVIESWTDPVSRDPLDALARGLDVPFEDAFAEFAARNATWDYRDGDTYAYMVEYYAEYLGMSTLVDTVDGATDGLVEAPSQLSPERYGYNVLRLEGAGDWRVTFAGDTEGTRGSAAAWRTILVTPDGNGVARTAFEDSIDFESDGDAWLVVASVPESSRSGESFAWSYSIEAVEPDPIDTGDTADTGDSGDIDTATDGDGFDRGGIDLSEAIACGCTSGGSAALNTGWVVALGALALRRRRA